MKNLLFIVIVAVAMMIFSCESMSGKRERHRIDETIVLKADLIQKGQTISFAIYDTTGYIVNKRVYYSHISNVFEIDEGSVVVAIAYPDEDQDEIFYLPIE